MSASSCPPEILLTIFSLVCTDGGFTGRSLSLVSRYWNSVASEVQYQTLILQSLFEVCHFAALLQSHPFKRKVRHLYIADYAPPRNPGETMDVASYAREDMCRYIAVILANVAPYLESLFLLLLPTIFGLSKRIAILPVTLPKLRELTVAGSFKGLHFQNSVGAPALKRLHVASICAPPDDFGRVLVAIAPNLTHLRVSEVRDGATELLALLRLFKDRKARQEYDPSATVHGEQLPRDLTRIIVSPDLRALGETGQVTLHFKRDLRTLHEQYRAMNLRPGALLVCNRGSTSYLHMKQALDERGTQEWYVRMKGLWFDRVHGGEGCWVEGDGWQA